MEKTPQSELTRTEADAILNQVALLPVTRHAIAPLLLSAFDLAVQAQRTVYDSLYLALAIQIGGQLVTADQKFYNSLSATQWAGSVCWIEDVP